MGRSGGRRGSRVVREAGGQAGRGRGCPLTAPPGAYYAEDGVGSDGQTKW